MSSENFYPNYDVVEYEFYVENSIDKVIEMLLEYKKRNFVYMNILNDGGMAFYHEETEEQRKERLEKERIVEEQRKQREIRAAEKREKNKKIKEVKLKLKKAQKLINNKNFVNKAKPEIVQQALKNYNNLSQELNFLIQNIS